MLMLTVKVQAENLRDPTRPGFGADAVPLSKSAQENALVLNSVMNKGHNAHAVINQQVFIVGDRVQGVKIIQIGTSSVLLADGRTLNMYQNITELKGTSAHDSD
ncbi:MSHA biogenesis protein MshK [Shewanella sp. VB17]|nr:MSHA biogenesis protein MshK [Shewanella sp. VB17]